MSDYLIHDLERAGRAGFATGARSRSCTATDGELEAVTLADGERLPFRDLFLFLGAEPHTDWLGDSVGARRGTDSCSPGTAAGEPNKPPGDQHPPGVYAIGGRALRIDQASGRGRRRGARWLSPFVHEEDRPEDPQGRGGAGRRGVRLTR